MFNKNFHVTDVQNRSFYWVTGHYYDLRYVASTEASVLSGSCEMLSLVGGLGLQVTPS